MSLIATGFPSLVSFVSTLPTLELPIAPTVGGKLSFTASITAQYNVPPLVLAVLINAPYTLMSLITLTRDATLILISSKD
jgi:hypothetical protein